MDISDLLDLDVTSLILFVCVGIIIWLAIREVKLWYWRINEIVNEQKQQTDILNDILNEIHAQRSTTKPTTTDNKSTP